MSYLPADRERLCFSTLTIFNTFLTQGWVSSPFYPLAVMARGSQGDFNLSLLRHWLLVHSHHDRGKRFFVCVFVFVCSLYTLFPPASCKNANISLTEYKRNIMMFDHHTIQYHRKHI